LIAHLECIKHRFFYPIQACVERIMSVLIKNGRIVTAVDDYMADVFIEG
jgi:hypothetical protein